VETVWRKHGDGYRYEHFSLRVKADKREVRGTGESESYEGMFAVKMDKKFRVINIDYQYKSWVKTRIDS